MIDCFVLAGVKTFSQRSTLPTREVAALSVLCFASSLSSAFSGVSQPSDTRITYSPLRVLRFQRCLNAKIHLVWLTCPSLLILFSYLRAARVASTAVRLLPPNTLLPIYLSIYFVARSQDVENRTARLVTRLQFLNHAAIICPFPRLGGFSSRCNYRVNMLWLFHLSMLQVTMNFMR